MNREYFFYTLQNLICMFSCKNEQDIAILTPSLISTINKNKDEYMRFAARFPYFEPSFSFFFFRVYREHPGLIKCLTDAEKRYKKEIDNGTIHPDWLRESLFKSCILALNKEIPFWKAFMQNIMKPTIDTRLTVWKRVGLKPSLGNSLNVALENLQDVGVSPQDLQTRDFITQN